ncbi:MAG: methionine sulfoxide reductase [Marteilia pararefringens]
MSAARDNEKNEQQLDDKVLEVLEEGGTEKPFSSPLLNEKRCGSFSCIKCGNLLFSSTHKFESGTGWPSFTNVADQDNSCLESLDESQNMTRAEVKCKKCGGHLGHVFDDNPNNNQRRYCINGVCLIFKAKDNGNKQGERIYE